MCIDGRWTMDGWLACCVGSLSVDAWGWTSMDIAGRELEQNTSMSSRAEQQRSTAQDAAAGVTSQTCRAKPDSERTQRSHEAVVSAISDSRLQTRDSTLSIPTDTDLFVSATNILSAAVIYSPACRLVGPPGLASCETGNVSLASGQSRVRGDSE